MEPNKNFGASIFRIGRRNDCLEPCSYLDPAIVGVGYRSRPVHFMARNTLWKPGFGTWWMDHVGCIPVARGTGDIRALKLTIKALREGKVVSMFPEGRRG